MRQAIISEAYSWLKTPYHACAKVKGVGVDCGMLLIAVYSTGGDMPEFDPGPYSPEWHKHRSEELYLNHMLRFFDEIPLAEAVPGDALVYKYGRTWSHGAIVVGENEVIHAYKGMGVILSTIGDYPLDNRVPRAFRLKGL